MSKTIIQKMVFKNTDPKSLFELYMDEKKHSHIAGSPCTITKKEDDKYSVHGGYISGKNLQLVKDKLIVQSWRAQGWDKDAVDSTFIIHLEKKGDDVMLHAVHANVPDEHKASISNGWHDHYWKPWKQYLAGKTITRPSM